MEDTRKPMRSVVLTRQLEVVELECRPFFRISACPEVCPRPEAVMADHPHFIDVMVEERRGVHGLTSYSYKLDEKPMLEDHARLPVPDFVANQHNHSLALQECLALVNALSSTYLFTYGSHQAWFKDLDDIHARPKYGQEMYSCDCDSSIDSIEWKEADDGLGPTVLHFRNESGELKQMVRVGDLFNAYFALPETKKKQDYLNACEVLSRAIRLSTIDQSASFMLLATAIEALVDIEWRDEEVEKCEECGQPRYRVVRKFRDFLDKYGYETPNKLKNEFYSLRSAFVHRGTLLPSDRIRKPFIETQEDFTATHDAAVVQMKFMTMVELTKVCFRTFLLFNQDTLGKESR